MNPGLVVKLRPAGPWRIGPDSGARTRVDYIYHSDSLYSAVTSAMARLGSLEEWLDATARQSTAAVCFSSCFPFLDEIGFVVPPRTIWPPTSPASMSARVRWKSARFVPLGIVQAILAGQRLDEKHWAVDGASECLVPAGRLGPFRTGVRWNAAVDRLTGAVERHSTACIEFRPGSGLWTVVSFLDDTARETWAGRVKAAFRLLADTGFGGERSRGWGRAESPEFIEGALPEMILPAITRAAAEPEPEPVQKPPVEPPVQEPPVEEPPVEQPPLQEPPADPETEAAASNMTEEGGPQIPVPEQDSPAAETEAPAEISAEAAQMIAEGDPQLPPPDPDPALPVPPEANSARAGTRNHPCQTRLPSHPRFPRSHRSRRCRPPKFQLPKRPRLPMCRRPQFRKRRRPAFGCSRCLLQQVTTPWIGRAAIIPCAGAQGSRGEPFRVRRIEEADTDDCRGIGASCRGEAATRGSAPDVRAGRLCPPGVSTPGFALSIPLTNGEGSQS